MITGINESAYSIGRNDVDMDRTFQQWRSLGIIGWRPNATTFIDNSDPSKLICSQAEYELQLVAAARRWTAIPGTEFLMPLINNNKGVEFAIRPDQLTSFTDFYTSRETGEINWDKVRTAIISCGLRVKHAGILNFCSREMRRIVMSLMYGIRATFEIGNADIDLWFTDWQNPMNLDADGKAFCNMLAPWAAPGNPRTSLIELWQKTFSIWERWTRRWITDSSFVYCDAPGGVKIQPSSGSRNVVECGATAGNLPAAMSAAKALNPQRVYFYSWTWAGYAWAGWNSDWPQLYTGSENDPEGYANLVNRQEEVRRVMAA